MSHREGKVAVDEWRKTHIRTTTRLYNKRINRLNLKVITAVATALLVGAYIAGKLIAG